jgi:hypothetical protein
MIHFACPSIARSLFSTQWTLRTNIRTQREDDRGGLLLKVSQYMAMLSNEEGQKR